MESRRYAARHAGGFSSFGTSFLRKNRQRIPYPPRCTGFSQEGSMGFEESSPTEGRVKNMPVACFLARGRIPVHWMASPQGVSADALLIYNQLPSRGILSFFFINWGFKKTAPVHTLVQNIPVTGWAVGQEAETSILQISEKIHFLTGIFLWNIV